MTKTWSTAIKSCSAESLVKEIAGPEGPVQVIRWVDERVEAQSRGSNVKFKAEFGLSLGSNSQMTRLRSAPPRRARAADASVHGPPHPRR